MSAITDSIKPIGIHTNPEHMNPSNYWSGKTRAPKTADKSFGPKLSVPFVEVYIGNFVCGTFPQSKYYVSADISQSGNKSIDYTINIQYNPDTFKAGEPNYIEQHIKSQLGNGKLIYIRFGYRKNSPYTNTSQSSQFYAGLITSMITSVDKNAVSYTIKAFGNEISANDTVCHFRPIPIAEPLHYSIKNICADIFPDWEFESDIIPSYADLIGMTQEDIYSYSHGNKSEIPILNGENTSNLTVFEYLTNIIKWVNQGYQLYNKKSKDYNAIQLVFIPIVTSINSSKVGTIKVVNMLNKSNHTNFTYSSKPDYALNKVLSWNCDFEDTALMYAGKTTQTESKADMNNGQAVTKAQYNAMNITVVDLKGSTQDLPSVKRNITATSDVVKNMLKFNDTLSQIQSAFYYPYKATATVLGNPDKVFLCYDCLTINVLVNRQKHHTSGKYLITGISHSISSGQFTTTYTLVKLKDENAQTVDGYTTDDLLAVSKGSVQIQEQKYFGDTISSVTTPEADYTERGNNY